MLYTRRLSSRDEFYIFYQKSTLRLKLLVSNYFLHTVSTVHLYMLYNSP
jgi:hypothetical protein